MFFIINASFTVISKIVKAIAIKNIIFQNFALNSIFIKAFCAVIIYINVKQNAYLYNQYAGTFPKCPN